MIKIILTSFFIVVYLSNISFADDKAQKIINQVDKQGKKQKHQLFDVEMQIYNKKNHIRKRYFTQKRLIAKNDQAIIKFYKPATVKNTAVLTHSDQNNKTQWIYLPALSSVRQLSSSEKNNSFVGSDFSYEDIAGRHPFDDKHNFIKETDKYYIINSFPKKHSSYSKLELVIDKKRFVVIRIKFFNKDKKLLKTLTNKKIEKITNMYVITEAIMLNNFTKGKTILKITDIDFSKKWTDFDFSVGNLQNF